MNAADQTVDLVDLVKTNLISDEYCTQLHKDSESAIQFKKEVKVKLSWTKGWEGRDRIFNQSHEIKWKETVTERRVVEGERCISFWQQ